MLMLLNKKMINTPFPKINYITIGNKLKDENIRLTKTVIDRSHNQITIDYFSLMKILIGVPQKFQFSRILFSRKRL